MLLLEEKNAHPRDELIKFKEDGHIYTLNVNNEIVNPLSVTTLIHKFFPHFDADLILDKMFKSGKLNPKYEGKTKTQIKAEWDENGKTASGLGTLMHADIERFLNDIQPLNKNSIEFGYFMNFWTSLTNTYPNLKPFRTEWIVYDEDKNLAGSIDCILENDKGDLVILDWKRSKEIKYDNRFETGYTPFNKLDNCNYNHYTLQLNIYRHLLQTKYRKKILYMMLVILHPNNTDYVCIPVQHYDIASVWDKLF